MERLKAGGGVSPSQAPAQPGEDPAGRPLRQALDSIIEGALQRLEIGRKDSLGHELHGPRVAERCLQVVTPLPRYGTIFPQAERAGGEVNHVPALTTRGKACKIPVP